MGKSTSLHVISHVVFPGDVVVETVWDMVKLSLGKPTHKTLGLHLIGQRFFFVSQFPKCINDQTWEGGGGGGGINKIFKKKKKKNEEQNFLIYSTLRSCPLILGFDL